MSPFSYYYHYHAPYMSGLTAFRETGKWTNGPMARWQNGKWRDSGRVKSDDKRADKEFA